MKVAYAKLFEIKLYHQYYADKLCPDFQIVPTAECSQLLSNYRLRSQATPSGFMVFASIEDTNTLEATLAPALSDAIRFEFELRLVNNSFFNFTQLPLDLQSNQFFYFTNTNTNEKAIAGITGDQLLLSNAASDQVDANDVRRIMPYFSNVKFTNPVNNYQFQVDGNNLGDPITLAANEVPFDYQLEFRRKVGDDYVYISKGPHTLSRNGTDENIYLSRSLTNQSPFGLISIEHSAQVDASYRLYNGSNQLTAKTYAIHFNSWSTIWKYVLNEIPAGLVAPNFTIDAPNKTLTANSARSLSETYQSLSVTANGVSLTLPNPSPNVPIKPDSSGSPIFSEMYIYL